jgi:hypothetical protein
MTELRTAEPRLRRLIDAAAAFYGLPRFQYRGHSYSPGELLEGLVLTESSGNPAARRYEPHQDRAGRADAPTDPDRPAADDGDFEDDASYGALQVMGYNLRRLVGVPVGVRMSFAWAYDAGVSLWAGCQILRFDLAAVYREFPHAPESERVIRALARYNGGPSGDDPTGAHGDIRLRAYVDKVAENTQRAYVDRHEKGWMPAA